MLDYKECDDYNTEEEYGNQCTCLVQDSEHGEPHESFCDIGICCFECEEFHSDTCDEGHCDQYVVVDGKKVFVD